MGGGLGGSIGSSRGILSENIKALSSEHPLNSGGRFGRRGQGRTQVVKVPDPQATARHFFLKLGKGGVKSTLSNGKGEVIRFDDGSRVVFRPQSKSGGPAIDITNTATGNNYKIHFESTKGGTN